jgi:hypothetical protein
MISPALYAAMGGECPEPPEGGTPNVGNTQVPAAVIINTELLTWLIILIAYNNTSL